MPFRLDPAPVRTDLLHSVPTKKHPHFAENASIDVNVATKADAMSKLSTSTCVIQNGAGDKESQRIAAALAGHEEHRVGRGRRATQ